MTHDVTCVYIIVPQYSRKKAKTADSWAGEGCTLFVFLAEHRGIAHGPLRHSTGNRGHSTGYRGHSMGFHGKPRQVAKHRGGPWHYPWQFPRQSPRQRPGKDPRQRRRTCPRTRPRKDPRTRPRAHPRTRPRRHPRTRPWALPSFLFIFSYTYQ